MRVLSKTHWTGESTAADERQVHHLAVVDHVHVDDRRRAEPGPARRAADAGRARQPRRLRGRNGEHDAIDGQRLAVAGRIAFGQAVVVADQPASLDSPLVRSSVKPPPAAGLMAFTLALILTCAPRLASSSAVALSVQVAERHGRDADVGGVLGAEQRRLDHGRRQRQVGVVPGDVQRGDDEQVPQPAAGQLALAVAASQSPSRWSSSRRIGRVDEPHRERGPADLQPVGQRQQPVPGQRRGQVQRARQSGAAAARAGPPGPRTVTSNRSWKVDLVGHAEPGQQRLVAARSSAGSRAGRCRSSARRAGRTTRLRRALAWPRAA